MARKIEMNHDVVGMAAGGSWITHELDEYSDLDLVLVTREKISDDKQKMLAYAEKFGTLLEGFTGEHVGEPRVLICLYDNPLLHVDIKFVTPDELKDRVEDPEVLWERDGELTQIIKSTKSEWPALDSQWIEDRFWIWVHYITLKIGRGEYFEALDSLSYLRMNVIAPLMQIKNGNLPRGVRKAEFDFSENDLRNLKESVAEYSPESIIKSLEKMVDLYMELRKTVFPETVKLNGKISERVRFYLSDIKTKLEREGKL